MAALINRLRRLETRIEDSLPEPACPSCQNLGHQRNFLIRDGHDEPVPDPRIDDDGRCMTCGRLPDPVWSPAPVYSLPLPADLRARLEGVAL